MFLDLESGYFGEVDPSMKAELELDCFCSVLVKAAERYLELRSVRFEIGNSMLAGLEHVELEGLEEFEFEYAALEGADLEGVGMNCAEPE